VDAPSVDLGSPETRCTDFRSEAQDRCPFHCVRLPAGLTWVKRTATVARRDGAKSAASPGKANLRDTNFTN